MSPELLRINSQKQFLDMGPDNSIPVSFRFSGPKEAYCIGHTNRTDAGGRGSYLAAV